MTIQANFCVSLGNTWCSCFCSTNDFKQTSIKLWNTLLYSSAIYVGLIVLPALISKHVLLLWWPPTGTHLNGHCCCIMLYMYYIVFVGNKISINYIGTNGKTFHQRSLWVTVNWHIEVWTKWWQFCNDFFFQMNFIAFDLHFTHVCPDGTISLHWFR